MNIDYTIKPDGLFSVEGDKDNLHIDKIIYFYSSTPKESIISVLKGHFKNVEKKEYTPDNFEVENNKNSLIVLDLTNMDESEIFYETAIFSEKYNGVNKRGYIVIGSVNSFSTYSSLRKYGGLYSNEESLSILISDIIRSDFKILYSISDNARVKNGCMIISSAGGVGGSSISNEISSYLYNKVDNIICLFEKNRTLRTLGILNEVSQDNISLDDVSGDVIQEHFKTFSSEIRSNFFLYSLEAQTAVGNKNHEQIEKILSERYYFFIADYSFSEVYTCSSQLTDKANLYDKFLFVTDRSLSSVVHLCKMLVAFKDAGIGKEKIKIIINENGVSDISKKILEEKFKEYTLFYLPFVSRDDYVSTINTGRIKLSKKYRKEIHKICVAINNNNEFDKEKEKEKVWTKKLNWFTRKH